jgi:hypothetical protein
MPALGQNGIDLRQVLVHGGLIAAPGGQDDAGDEKVAR